MNPLTSVVLETYRSNWQKFYYWKRDYNTNCLDSLLKDCKPPSNDLLDDPPANIEEDLLPVSGDKSSESTLRVTEYTDDDCCEEYTLSFETFTVKPDNKPYADYTSCTTIRRSSFIGDDLNPMPFLPFSDDPTFNHQVQMLVHYETFAWQEAMDDPDCESQVLERDSKLMWFVWLSRSRLRANSKRVNDKTQPYNRTD